jgi:hypothetical protein
LLASRAEASRERYAPRASSPPASIPAFGGSNVWRAPVTENKPSAAPAAPPKPAQPSSALSCSSHPLRLFSACLIRASRFNHSRCPSSTRKCFCGSYCTQVRYPPWSHNPSTYWTQS